MSEKKNALALTVSVVLNVFFIGLMAGHFLGAGPTTDWGHPPLPPDRLFEHLSADLAPEEAKKLRAIFEEKERAMEASRATMREDLQKIAALIELEKPDRAALRRELDKMGFSGQAFHAAMARAMDRVVSELSAESRRKIAEKIRNPSAFPPPGPPPPPPPGKGR